MRGLDIAEKYYKECGLPMIRAQFPELETKAAVMSQAGQYNLLRCLDRGDRVAAMLSLGKFTEAAISVVYLLNRRYMPFYKWAYHGAKDLPKMQNAVQKIGELAKIFDGSKSDSNFLQDHLTYIMEGIRDPQIRNLPPIYDYGF